MGQAQTQVIPESLRPFAGRILDCDAHENAPINHWVDRFGSIAGDLAEALRPVPGQFSPPKDTDDTPITAASVWETKLSAAPGAFDMSRRLDVLDFTGVSRQLMFPGAIGLSALTLFYLHDQLWHMPTITGDRRTYAHKVATAYNEWCVRQQRETSRLVPVALLLGQNPGELTAEVRNLTDRGVRAFWVPSAQLPGGVSPAHPALDPFYSILSSAGACLCLHPGGDMDATLLKTYGWRDIPAFKGFKQGSELPLDPWSFCNLARAVEVFLTTLVLGAVFERHPTLRLCIAENSADWIGPITYRMDMWMAQMKFFENSGNMYQPGKGLPISRKPSEYVRQNVRVAVFEFEDVGAYIEKYGLEDVYCYASDYPHPEGGEQPMGRTFQSLVNHNMSRNVMEKFYVTNGEWIMPG